MQNEEFYPQHFRRTRPYTKELLESLQEAYNRRALNPQLGHKLTGDIVLRYLVKGGANIQSPDFDMQGYAGETQAALLYAQWARSGSAVYAFNSNLAEALGATSVGDVTIEDLKFPFECAYFHFGPLPGLNLASGQPVTGAFIQMAPGLALRISLAAPMDSHAPWPTRYAELYNLPILARHFDKDMETAINEAVADDYRDIESVAERTGKMPSAVGDARQRTIEAALSNLQANREVFIRYCNLIANALCYVTAYSDDIALKWQTATPEKLRAVAETGLPKKAANAVSKLNAMGYRRVHYVGEQFGQAVVQGEAGSVSPHWRRGHWRAQAHGPGFSLRKLKWLRPMRILGGQTSDTPRVYATTPPSDAS